MEKVFSEWFWSEYSATQAAERVTKKGYLTTVEYSISADGEIGWLVSAF